MRPHAARIEAIEASRTSEGVCADDRDNERTGPRAGEEGKLLPTYRPLDEADPALVWSPSCEIRVGGEPWGEKGRDMRDRGVVPGRG